MKYAPKEVQKYLPKDSLINVNWHWWWFKRMTGYRFFMKSRIANALDVWVGPVHISIRRPYLYGPARQLHPDAFIRAGREDLL